MPEITDPLVKKVASIICGANPDQLIHDIVWHEPDANGIRWSEFTGPLIPLWKFYEKQARQVIKLLQSEWSRGQDRHA